MIKLAFTTGTDDLNRGLISAMKGLYPELSLWVVSDFRPEDATVTWIRWHQNRTLWQNLALCRSAVRGHRIRLAGVMLVPGVPFRRMRLAALLLAPARFIAFNENLNHFMLRPGSLPTMARHAAWRIGNLWRSRGTGLPHAEELPAAMSASETYAGRPATGKPRILIAACYPAFPLSHGGAVRMYNLMLRAAATYDQILITFSDELCPPAAEILAICTEVTTITRVGTHSLPKRGRPDAVEEFDSPLFRKAIAEAVRKWRPAVAQLEFTQMAQYADACAPVPTLLVEHDITVDLYRQMLKHRQTPGDHVGEWELEHQLKLWERFEHSAWRRVTRVITMSEKDRQLVGAKAVTLPNGVDLERFQPSREEPEPNRILFIGSFAHLPNLIALEFFLSEVWPLLEGAVLHVIAGNRPEYFLAFHRDSVNVKLDQPRIEVESFVADVRPAYLKAAVVVAPLLASAGTNIKILEAMAMGKAVVSTPAGINGLDLAPGTDLLLACNGAEMVHAIKSLLADSDARRRLEASARQAVERDFGWDKIAARQSLLYAEFGSMQNSPDE